MVVGSKRMSEREKKGGLNHSGSYHLDFPELFPDCEALFRIFRAASQVLSSKDNPSYHSSPLSISHTSRDATLVQALGYAFFAVAL